MLACIGTDPLSGDVRMTWGQLNRLADRCDPEDNVEALVSLAPFLSADSLSRLVSRCNLSDHAEALCALAPFLPQDQLNALFSRIAGGRKHD